MNLSSPSIGTMLWRWLRYQWYQIDSHFFSRTHLLDLRDKENGYAGGWLSQDSKILFACMAVLEQFMKHDFIAPGVICVDDLATKQELTEIHNWWSSLRKEELRKLKSQLVDARKSVDADSSMDAYRADFARLVSTETEMLLRLVQIRSKMWLP